MSLYEVEPHFVLPRCDCFYFIVGTAKTPGHVTSNGHATGAVLKGNAPVSRGSDAMAMSKAVQAMLLQGAAPWGGHNIVVGKCNAVRSDVMRPPPGTTAVRTGCLEIGSEGVRVVLAQICPVC